MGKLCKGCVGAYGTVIEIGGGMMDGGYDQVMSLGNVLCRPKQARERTNERTRSNQSLFVSAFFYLFIFSLFFFFSFNIQDGEREMGELEFEKKAHHLPYPYYSQPRLRSFWVRYREGRQGRR